MLNQSSSDSQSDTDSDFEILSTLKGTPARQKRTKSTPPTSTTKRLPSTLTETDINIENDVDIKPFKMPKLEPPPLSFLESSHLDVLNKSKQMVVLHQTDQERALEILKEEDDLMDVLKNQLSKDALKDKDYVDFVKKRFNELKLLDCFIVGVPKFVEPSEDQEDKCMLEASSIQGRSGCKITGDFFNTINYRLLERMEFKFDGSVVEFAEFIGIKKDIMDAEKIDAKDLRFDPGKRLQKVDVIILRVKRYVNSTVQLKFDLEKWTQLVKLIGLLMFDKRSHEHGSAQAFSEIINMLLKWGYKTKSNAILKDVIHIWDGLTDLKFLKYRIIEKLESQFSNMIKQLKTLFCLVLLTEGRITQIEYLDSDTKLTELVNITLLDELAKISNGKELDRYMKEQSKEANYYFYQLRLRFQCMMHVLSKPINRNEGDEYQDPIAKKTIFRLKELQAKINISYEKAEQTGVKSVIMMMISKLDGH